MNNHKSPAITIHTLAYNVEKYINECADSLLNQTFIDFEWVVLDNGSTDQTGGILEEYARKDSRIKLFKNKRNTFIHNEPINPDFQEFCRKQEFDYWCSLDSDDYLHPDFLKDLYTAAIERNADIAIGGTEHFRDQDPSLRGRRCPPDFYAAEITALGDIFPNVYGSFRTMWGKLVKYSVIQKQVEYRLKNPVILKNAGDTLFSLDLLKFSNSVIGINRVLHYYRIRKSSLYHTLMDSQRYLDYVVLYQESKLLLENWNQLNTTNKEFVVNVLYHSLIDCLKLTITASSVAVNDRLEAIEMMLSDEIINEVILRDGLSQKLLYDMHQMMDSIFNHISELDIPIATTHYIYRLFLSIRMGKSVEGNKHNAFLLYISALSDEKNRSRFGLIFLQQFFALIGKSHLVELEKNNISNEYLVSSPLILREVVNGQDNGEKINDAKEQIEMAISTENYDEAIDILLKILDESPLDKIALSYKMFFLSMNSDITTLVETAVTLTTFYPDDYTSLSFAAQAFVFAGLKKEAKMIYQKALRVCPDKKQQSEIIKELEAI